MLILPFVICLCDQFIYYFNLPKSLFMNRLLTTSKEECKAYKSLSEDEVVRDQKLMGQ